MFPRLSFAFVCSRGALAALSDDIGSLDARRVTGDATTKSTALHVVSRYLPLFRRFWIIQIETNIVYMLRVQAKRFL